MEANQSGSDQIGRYILLCGCGSRIIAAFPLAKDARYTCSSCSSLRTEKSRLTRVHNEAKSTALRGRLEPFLSLQLEGHEREWFELAQDIKVDAVALEALVAIIQEGKWQQSTAPLMFVRINVERRSKQWQDPFTEDGQLKRAQIFSSVPTHEDREWLRFWTDIKEQGSRVTPEDIEAASRTLSVVEEE
jgi:hypothetical protein